MELLTFYILHGTAIVALALSSYGVGYQVAKGSVKDILTKKEN
jgi:hypothetical protein